ncbi:T9SS type A sorting domain-containing protein [Flavobacterium sp.]|uniref:T9SS type A sorting domain-containing protein n=1 Tax=Flavobacterium sp. TaxID=239 RepID=UPI002B4B3E5D|nr:T9SS type A sorting domain-containing protein [Flavobacterium sp.]HLP64758.1 T9SS type A sorting domain-containing protein [Flavobacterium sp.]
MRIQLLLGLSLLFCMHSVQAQEVNWATAASGAGYEYGIKSTQDAAGNTYLIGYTIGDNSSGSNTFLFNGVNYPVVGRGDVFFAKLDTAKQLVWMKTMGGNDTIYYDEPNDIHIDPFGDIYITFKSVGFNVTYNGQPLSGVGSIGQYGGEGVLLKVNSNGNYLWHDSGTTASIFERVTTDAAGNVYLTGTYDSNIILGGTITLNNPSTFTTMDMMVAKYQPNGTILWAKKAGGAPQNTFAFGIDLKINPQTNQLIVLVDGQGYVYFDDVLMPFNGSIERGLLLVSYNLDGTRNWIKRVLDEGNYGWDVASSLAISPSGIMGVTGYTPAGNPNGKVGFYTSDGSVISEHTYPSTNSLRVLSMAFNEYNEAYIAGQYNGSIVLGMNPGTASLTGYKGFIAKMDVLQQIKWVQEIDGVYGFDHRVDYQNSKVLFAARIDEDFTYNSGQSVIVNNSGDALYGEITDYQLSANRCNITGTVFQDIDANCSLNTGDVVQNAVIVKATDSNGLIRYSISNSEGHYDIPVDVGSYTVAILPNPVQSSLIQQNCYTQQSVTLTAAAQDATNVNFPIELANCPLLNVDVSSDRRRRCFDSNTYVSYQNSGFATAQNVEVIVQLPEYVTLISSDHPYTINAQGNYVFFVGQLNPNQSGLIHIVDHTNCIDGITGLTQCTTAWITPANDCATALDPNYANWDKSVVRVAGSCLNPNQVEFTIVNTSQPGIGDMLTPRQYRIYVDNALAVTETYQLNGGQSTVVNYPANGQTIRLEVDQHPMYMGDSIAQQTVEGCGSVNGQMSTGFVDTMPMGDEGIATETHCLPIIDSFDPNDKIVSPTGITANHYVQAGTELDYMIRFQNTGTDTAYKVVIKDTLSNYLDPSTIQWGLSSHPYTITITGTETPVLEFTFDNINLPHSAANELASNGFVKFKARTYAALANGIEVNNNASIYFDYNFPVVTNTAQVIISDLVLTYVPLSVVPFEVQDISIYPNPTSGLLVIESDALEKVEIYSMSGILLETSNQNEINLSHYSKGIYLIKMTTNKGVALKKVILK